MSTAFFDLVQDLARLPPDQSPALRHFAPPLAAPVPPAGSGDPFELAANLPPSSAYTFFGQAQNAGGRTVDFPLGISIKKPYPGDADAKDPANPNLPAPAIRLHAVTRGKLSYRPAAAQLILTTQVFRVLPPGVKWWQRWSEAESIPRQIIYENVDPAHLPTHLHQVQVGGSFGIKFPNAFDDQDKVTNADEAFDFIENFLVGDVDSEGNPTHYLVVEAGAVIGQADIDGSFPTQRLLTLRVRYDDHAVGNEWPMNPRELLYLIFGNSGSHATAHPLFLALDTFDDDHRDTNGTRLRPPLRTWKRLVWEAELEESIQTQLGTIWWNSTGAVPTGALYDDTPFRPFVDGGTPARVAYDGVVDDKCNIFTSDICVRAGFRAMIIRNPTVWHYPTAASHAHTAVAVLKSLSPGTGARVAVMGNVPDGARLWGYALTSFITETGTTMAEINAWMDEEGRALIVAGARPRKFVMKGSPPVPVKVEGTGHIVLVVKMTGEPGTVTNNDSELPTLTQKIQKLELISAQAASPSGANWSLQWDPELLAGGGGASSTKNFIRLHLLEPAAGRDPDLLQGLFDLHVRRGDPNQLHASIDN